MQTYIKDILKTEPENQIIKVQGWIRTSRDTKNVCFFELSDGSCLKGLQVILDKAEDSLAALVPELHTGVSIEAEGVLVASPGGNQAVELQAKNLTVFGDAPADTYPLQKKRHSFEFLREIAHLRPRTNTIGAVTRVRSRMSFAIHSFFQNQGFQYVHTPIISASDAEGAGEMFQVTNLPLDKIVGSDAKEIDYTRDFFGKQTHLTVSGQLEAEIYALALKNVYTFGPTFRAENSNTSRHLAEFWMIEPEMAFCALEGNMAMAEEFLKYVIKDILENCSEDMELFNKWIEKGVADSLVKVVDSKFVHLPYTDAVDELIKAKKEFEYPVKWGTDLQSEHEKYLTEEVFKCPVIVTDYPKDIKAFYMKQNDDGKTVRAMDILVPRLGEIIGGSQREEDHDKLLGRIRELDLHEEDYWWYLELRKFGTVPHSGFGLGFERLIQYVTGMQNIRDVIPFPRASKTAEF
ncbi:MAG: asparagine--tRNA ligase [Spirochaetales bacterium]|nr:asparagine--tRNA ligase [Spirochaetales bacterium]